MDEINQNPIVPPELPKRNWFSTHWILGVVFLFAVAGCATAGIYYWWTVRAIPPTVESPVHKDPTAGWETYSNSEYGFEFKYPESFSLDLSSKDQFTVALKGIHNDSNFFYVLPKGFTDPGRKSLFSAGVQTQSVQLAGMNAREYQGTQDSFIDKIFNFYSYPSFWTAENEIGYQIDDQMHVRILDQILSTFRFVESQAPNQKEIVEADINIVADFAQFRVGAEIYYDKYNMYPKTEGTTPESRWQSFVQAMIDEKIMVTVPQDPRQKIKGSSFDYQTDPSRQSAVFKATLEAPDSPDVMSAIKATKDVDGIVYGLNCNKPNYCVKISIK